MTSYGTEELHNEKTHSPENINELIQRSTENEVNKVVEGIIDKIGAYQPTYIISASWEELPELGPYVYGNCNTYVGQYKKGLRHGEGREISKDGSLYEGTWADDKKHGKGRYINKLGD